MEMWWARLHSSANCSDFLPNPDSRLTETDLYWRESPPPRTSQRNRGEVLAPGSPADPVQLIDVRDLAAWLITLVERGTTEVFNATGPENRLSWGNLLEACRKSTKAENALTWVPGDWVAKQGGDGFPIWAPYLGETKGFHTWKNTRAVKAGLVFRPYGQTVMDTLRRYRTQGEAERTKLAGPSAAKEAELLAAWKVMKPVVRQ